MVTLRFSPSPMDSVKTRSMIAQFQMDNAPLGGGHRLQRHRSPAVHGLLGHAPGQLSQLPLAPGAVAFDVDDNREIVAELLADDQTRDVLQGGERFAAAADEQTQVVAADIDQDRARLLRLIRLPPAAAHPGRQPHARDELPHGVAGDLDLSIGRGARVLRLLVLVFEVLIVSRRGSRRGRASSRSAAQQRQPDARLAAAQAQNALSAFIEHFHQQPVGSDAKFGRPAGNRFVDRRGDHLQAGSRTQACVGLPSATVSWRRAAIALGAN